MKSSEEKFNEVVADILIKMQDLEYEDREKDLMKYELLQVFWRLTEDIEIFRENVDILNEHAVNGQVKMREIKFK